MRIQKKESRKARRNTIIHSSISKKLDKMIAKIRRASVHIEQQEVCKSSGTEKAARKKLDKMEI